MLERLRSTVVVGAAGRVSDLSPARDIHRTLCAPVCLRRASRQPAPSSVERGSSTSWVHHPRTPHVRHRLRIRLIRETPPVSPPHAQTHTLRRKNTAAGAPPVPSPSYPHGGCARWAGTQPSLHEPLHLIANRASLRPGASRIVWPALSGSAQEARSAAPPPPPLVITHPKPTPRAAHVHVRAQKSTVVKASTHTHTGCAPGATCALVSPPPPWSLRRRRLWAPPERRRTERARQRA